MLLGRANLHIAVTCIYNVSFTLINVLIRVSESTSFMEPSCTFMGNRLPIPLEHSIRSHNASLNHESKKEAKIWLHHELNDGSYIVQIEHTQY